MTAVEKQRTPLGVVLGQLAEKDPDAPALTHEGRTLSRAELERRTTRLAHAYAARGVKADDFVTIGLPNGIEFFEAVLACWKLGAIPQPVSHRLPPNERREIIALRRRLPVFRGWGTARTHLSEAQALEKGFQRCRVKSLRDSGSG